MADVSAAPDGAPALEAPAAAEKADALSPPRGWLSRYVAFLERCRSFVMLFWLSLFVVGMVGVTRVFSNLKLEIGPVPGDANDLARAALRSSFPTQAVSQTTTVMLWAAGASAATPLDAVPAARAVAARLTALAPAYIADGLLSANSGASYYTYLDAGLLGRAGAMRSPDGTAQLLQYFSLGGYVLSKEYLTFLEELQAELKAALDAAGGAVDGAVTGTLPINAESSSSITMDIGKSDAITVTLSFLLLALALRSLRLIGLTLLALAAAFGGAFLLTWPLTTVMSTPNFVTSLLISTLVSLSLDYSLFLLCHLKESMRAGVPMPRAVEDMLRSSGHTVLVSGATLAACFLVLGIFPVSIVRAPGIATTFAVVMSVLVNLSLTPALLLRFPGFFAGCSNRKTGEDEQAQTAGDAAEASAAVALRRRVASLRRALDAADPWARVASLTWRYRYALTFALLALLVAPFAYRLRAFKVSQGLRNIMPRGAESVETYYALQERFGPGAVAGAKLLGVATATSASPGAALTPQFFASAAAAVAATLAASSADELQATDVFGLHWQSGAATNSATMQAALAATSACPATTAAACVAACPAQACELQLLRRSLLSADGAAAQLTLNIRVPPNEDAGIAWARSVRAALDAANAADATATWHLLVDPSSDSIQYIYDRLGMLVGITAAVVFCILLIAFRSVAISLRAVATLAAMEIAVFGAASAIYCQGALNPGGMLHTFSSDNGLFWLMPILAFSLTTGLGLDYDIFLLTSVVEEREAGWSDTDAVAVGLQRSGPVISWAGIIMAVAFGGFLFSEIPLLNQLGFFVVFAVLVDTFVVRPLLVPAVMNCLGRANYWPRTMPPPTLGPLVLLAAPGGAGDDSAQHKPKQMAEEAV